jgi:hypothetical protein
VTVRSPGPATTGLGRNTEGELLYALCSQNPTFATRYDLATWKELGAGRFGGVIKVHCRSRKEDVAVKVYYKTSPEERRRLAREATVSQRVHDAHVVRIHTPFEEPDLVWVEMEYVDGEDLQSYLSSLPPEPLPFQPGAEALTRRTLDIADAITKGVAAAAAANIIHRDIKPHNILLLRQPYERHRRKPGHADDDGARADRRRRRGHPLGCVLVLSRLVRALHE